MKNAFSSFQGTRRTLRKATVVLSALTFGLSGCTSPSTAPQQQEEQEQYVSASFAIKSSDFYDSSGASPNHSVSAASLRRSAQAFSFADVATLRISVKDKLTGAPIYLRYDLSSASGEWSGQLPFLPKDKALTFSAEARDASGTLLFQGSTDQTLTKSDTVIISLAAANDGKIYSIPRIRKISVPSAVRSDQVGNVSFSVEATTGEALSYEITSPEGGGSFTPTTGTITLTGTVGTFVSQYSPPAVTADAQFEHTVKITNAAGNSVVTTFKTQVKPPGSIAGVTDTDIQVLFRPVINSVTASRQLGTGDVLFQADVAAEDPASSLGYHWSFTPAPGTHFDPMPAFSGDTNPSTLKSYTTAVQGTLSLQVTDKHGGKTTLFYPLPINQFPDNPVVEGGLTGLNSIRAGDNHTCVLFNNGAVRCWGLNTSGQLGYGNTLHVGDARKPYEAGDVELVGVGAKLVTGGNHTCALLDTGLVRCWGNNDFGQLGLNLIGNVGDAEPIASYGYVNLGGLAVKLAAGGEHTCALMDTGKVRCWGHNTLGQLGYGDSTTEKVGDDEQPYSEGDVELGGPVKDITAGGSHTCALLQTGSVRCWGYNGYGQLGTGNTINVGMHDKPTAVAEVNVGGPVKQLSAGKNHTCALLETGKVRCWGYNGNGQLGYNHASNIYTPVSANAGDVDTDGQVIQVSAGDQHTCALLATGAIKCWGYGANGRLGYGTRNSRLAPPTDTVDLDGSSAYQVEAGGNHTCALLVTGAARCWGYNGYGQLGYGNTKDMGDDELPSAAGDIQVLAP